jgi:hypothetical protein
MEEKEKKVREKFQEKAPKKIREKKAITEDQFKAALDRLEPFGGFEVITKLVQRIKYGEYAEFLDPAKGIATNQSYLEGDTEDMIISRKRLNLSFRLAERLIGKSSNLHEFEENKELQIEEALKLLNANLGIVLKKVRPMERAWKELKLFFDNTDDPDEVENLVLLCVSDDGLKSDATAGFVNELLKSEHKAIDKRGVFSLVAAPQFLGKKLWDRYATIAHNNRVLFFTSYREDDLLTLKTLYKNEVPGGKGQEWSSVIFICNSVLDRKAHNVNGKEVEDAPLFLSPVAPIVGKEYGNKRISQPMMGALHGQLKGVPATKYKSNEPNEDDFKKFFEYKKVIPLFHYEGGIQGGGINTAYTEGTLELQHYSIVRVLSYIGKTIAHFLNKCTFTIIDRTLMEEIIRPEIRSFFKTLMSDGIIEGYEIEKLEPDPEKPDRVILHFRVKPYFAAKEFVVTISSYQRNSEVEIDQK